MKETVKEILIYPFNKAFENGDRIDFIPVNGGLSDRRYMEENGRKLTFSENGDCYVEGVDGLRCSFYDWSGVQCGSLLPNATEEARDLFLTMVKEHIVVPSKITLSEDKNTEYTMAENWQKFDEKTKSWLFIGRSPYKE